MQTREEWLTRCAHALIDKAVAPAGLDTNAETGEPLAEKLRVAAGWPTHYGTRRRGRAIGQCFSPALSKGGYTEIFISPFIADSTIAGATLAHELLHAALSMKAGHGPVFKHACELIGLEGPVLATVPGSKLTGILTGIIAELGEYPHDSIDATSTEGKAGTRLLKCVCVNPDCPSQPPGRPWKLGKGYTVRITWKWASEGTPLCGICEERMAVYVPNAVAVAGGSGEESDVRIIAPGGSTKVGDKPNGNDGDNGEPDGNDGDNGEPDGEPDTTDGDEPPKDGEGADHRAQRGKGIGKGQSTPIVDGHPANLTCPCESCVRARLDAGLESEEPPNE